MKSVDSDWPGPGERQHQRRPAGAAAAQPDPAATELVVDLVADAEHRPPVGDRRRRPAPPRGSPGCRPGSHGGGQRRAAARRSRAYPAASSRSSPSSATSRSGSPHAVGEPAHQPGRARRLRVDQPGGQRVPRLVADRGEPGDAAAAPGRPATGRARPCRRPPARPAGRRSSRSPAPLRLAALRRPGARRRGSPARPATPASRAPSPARGASRPCRPPSAAAARGRACTATSGSGRSSGTPARSDRRRSGTAGRRCPGTGPTPWAAGRRRR